MSMLDMLQMISYVCNADFNSFRDVYTLADMIKMYDITELERGEHALIFSDIMID